jgi:hypothetical protein
MRNEQLATERLDPIIEYYKQFVDREALRANLELTPEERLRKFEIESQSSLQVFGREPVGPAKPWKAVSDTGSSRVTNPVIELYKRDVDRTLLRENLRRSPEQRLQQLESMADLVEALQSAAGRKRVRE